MSAEWSAMINIEGLSDKLQLQTINSANVLRRVDISIPYRNSRGNIHAGK